MATKKSWAETFKALPHVNEIWVTADGNFHLHPNKGGVKVTRLEVLDEEVHNPSDDELIKNIGKAQSVEEVEILANNSDSEAVAIAAKARKAELKTKPGKEELKAIEGINAAVTASQVKEMIKGENRGSVIEAANLKIVELNAAGKN